MFSDIVSAYVWHCAGKWQVEIRLSGKHKTFIGKFDDEVTAARAYDHLALQHGLEDRMNFPPKGVKALAVAYILTT